MCLWCWGACRDVAVAGVVVLLQGLARAGLARAQHRHWRALLKDLAAATTASQVQRALDAGVVTDGLTTESAPCTCYILPLLFTKQQQQQQAGWRQLTVDRLDECLDRARAALPYGGRHLPAVKVSRGVSSSQRVGPRRERGTDASSVSMQ